MNRVRISSVIVVLAASLIFFPFQKVNTLDKTVDSSYDTIIEAYHNDDYDKITDELNKIKQSWDEVQTWVGMTIDSAELEEIEISLQQCMHYAEIKDKEDFIGEFVLFNLLIKHLPFFEKLDLESLL